MFYEIGGFILVALLWGATNPFIKQGTKDITSVKSNSKVKQFLLEIKYLFTNFKYLIPMAINQLGSILYFFLLQINDISLAVPLTNSLTFVFTAITGWFLKEELPNKGVLTGISLILLGSTLLCLDKYP